MGRLRAVPAAGLPQSADCPSRSPSFRCRVRQWPRTPRRLIWTLPLPVLRRASSEPTTLPRSSVCQAGRSKNTAAPAPARSFASLAVASSMRSKTSKPGPPSAHATPRPIPDNSHPRAARFRRRAYAAVEGCHGCAARSTTSKSNSYTPSGPRYRAARRSGLDAVASSRSPRRHAAADRLSHG